MFSTPHPFLACDGPSLELGFLLMSFSLSGLYSRTVLLTLGPFQALGRMRPFSVWGPVCKANPINSAVPPPPAPARLNHKEPDFLLASFFLSLVFRIPVSCFLWLQLTHLGHSGFSSSRFYFFLSSETGFSKRRKTLGSSIWTPSLVPVLPVTSTSSFSLLSPFLQVGWKCLDWQGAGKNKWEHLWNCVAQGLVHGQRWSVNISLPYPLASGSLCTYRGFPVFTFMCREEWLSCLTLPCCLPWKHEQYLRSHVDFWTFTVFWFSVAFHAPSQNPVLGTSMFYCIVYFLQSGQFIKKQYWCTVIWGDGWATLNETKYDCIYKKLIISR